jgi:TRAP-type C4-dicarboxylate transport system permease small subunit
VALTEYALLYFTMAAAPWLVRQRGHIVVEILHARLPLRARRIADTAILVSCVMVTLLVGVIAGFLAVEAAIRGEVEVRSLDAPRWALFAPMSAGFALMGVEYLRLLVRGETVRPDETVTEPGL